MTNSHLVKSYASMFRDLEQSSDLAASRYLAQVEATAAAKHPLLLLAFAGSVALVGWQYWLSGATVWQRTSVMSGYFVLPIAVASFWLAVWISSRDARNETLEFIDSLPAKGWVRSVEALGAGLVPTGYAVLVLVIALAVGATGNPAGTAIWAEIVAAPIIVALAWLGGLLLGGVKRARILAPLVLLVVSFLELLASPDIELGASTSRGGNVHQLLPWVPPSAFDSPVSLMLRPSGQHFLFLLALLCVLLSLLLVRTTRNERLGRSARVVLVLFAVTTISLAIAVSRSDGARVDWTSLTASQTCRELDGVLYCAYEGFEAWIDDWRETVLQVQDVMPIDIKRVVQRPENTTFAEDDVLADTPVTGFEWDNPWIGAQRNRLNLAVALGNSEIGLPSHRRDGICSAISQGRSVFPLWLAGTAVEDGGEVIGSVINASGVVLAMNDRGLVGGAVVSREAGEVALEILENHSTTAVDVFDDRLPELSDSKLSLAAVAAWFNGVELPTDGSVAQLPVEPCP